MQISPKQLTSLSFSGFVVSLIAHLLAVSNIYIVSKIIIGALTIGMLAIWLISSRQIREEADTQENPWKNVFVSIPAWLRYFFIFIIIYGVVNAALNLQTGSSSGYFNFQVPASKVRLISSFWMIVYTFGFMVGLHDRKEQEK